jgi:hypothetical protein
VALRVVLTLQQEQAGEHQVRLAVVRVELERAEQSLEGTRGVALSL